MTRWGGPSTFPSAPEAFSGGWPAIAAERLQQVREPLHWSLDPGPRLTPEAVAARLALAARGAADDEWSPPAWLLPHQVDAARRLAGRLGLFGGALCADAPGLGKTYLGLALAGRYSRPVAVVPAALLSQWRATATRHGVPIRLLSHEGLSRGGKLPAAGLLVVDEAHRFRNPATRRYHALAARPPAGHLLLLTATPVVNRARDLLALLRLFLADNGLAIAGVPSLAAAEARRDYVAISSAARSVMVARSTGVVPSRASGAGVPAVIDQEVVTSPPLGPVALTRLLDRMSELRYPTFADRSAAQLLELHLRYRFASSASAGRETLERHRRYLDLALRAAATGRPLPRGAAGSLLADDWDGQFELSLEVPAAAAPLDATSLTAERQRIARLLAEVREAGPSPKMERLRTILSERDGRKTIVFTAAIATARALAATLGWRRLAVVTGAGAWIASGRIPIEQALALFAPGARRAARPAAAAQADVLIATDLASEGLDLQDADAIVHYDLPWTPLRLEQRLGRIRRLGSPHGAVRVWWFAPSPELDVRLALASRIADKRSAQLALGAVSSALVGRAQAGRSTEDWRECLAGRAQPGAAGAGHAVVAGPRIAALGVAWRRGRLTLPELVALDEAGGEPGADRRLRALFEALADDRAGVSGWSRAITRLIRQRLMAADAPTGDRESRRVANRLARRATVAGRRRETDLLQALDRALCRVNDGVPAGQLTTLSRALAGRNPARGLEAWLAASPMAPPVPWTASLSGLLAGNGPVEPTLSAAAHA